MNFANTSIQPNLFDFKPTLPSGFIYKPEFISRHDEIELLKYMQTITFGHLEIHGQVSKRGIKGYGVSYSFETGELMPGPRIPKFLYPLREQVANLVGKKAEDFEEILVTEYKPGSAISWHSDSSPYDVIVGVSLLNPCRFRLRRSNAPEGFAPQRGDWENMEIIAEPRSVYVMQGDSRWQWQHSIPPTTALRYSITLRTLRRNRVRA